MATRALKKLAVIDARMVGPEMHGIARYVTALAQGLLRLESKTSLSYTPAYLIHPSMQNHEPWKSLNTIECTTSFLSAEEWITIPRILSQSNAKIYHSTSFASLPFCPCPWMITLHDLNHLHWGGLSKRIYYNLLLKRFALGARKVMTVSEFSRKEIASWLKKSAAEIEIAYNSVSVPTPLLPDEEKSILNQYELTSGSYFFCHTNTKPHKNSELLIEAYRKSRKLSPMELSPLVLTLTGELKSEEGIRLTGPLHDHELFTLLRNAKAFFYPSQYEGFGIPPVEAALCGVPLYVSDIPPHREGLQDLDESHVRFLSATDLKAWTSAFRDAEAARFSGASNTEIEAVSARFSEIRLAKTMDQVYRNVLGLEK